MMMMMMTRSFVRQAELRSRESALLSYLAGECQLVTATGRRQIRSSDILTLWSSARPRVSATGASGTLQRGSGTDFYRHRR